LSGVLSTRRIQFGDPLDATVAQVTHKFTVQGTFLVTHCDLLCNIRATCLKNETLLFVRLVPDNVR
jgi:predicted metal-binding protein